MTTENKKKSAGEKNFIHPVTKTNHQLNINKNISRKKLTGTDHAPLSDWLADV